MSRLPDWEARLMAFISAGYSRPFVWGRWDCALFATACAAELTGEDRAAAFRGQYDTREGAALALRTLGKGTLLATMNDLFPLRPVGLARRGDLVAYGSSIGVCMGRYGLFVGEEGEREGLVSVPRGEFSRAWEV